jgi:hypothetical protein
MYFCVFGKDAIPEAISFGPGIVVPDFNVAVYEEQQIGLFTFIIQNRIGKNMENATINVTACENYNGKRTEAVTIGDSESIKLELSCEGLDMVAYQSETMDVVLRYNTYVKGEKFSHVYNGVMKLTPQRMLDFPDNNIGRRAWALHMGASGQNDENRFVPCDDVSGCANPDDLLLELYGGYVDSMTGKVWQTEDAPGLYNWSEKQGGKWDSIEPTWNPETNSYDYTAEEGTYLSGRDDNLGRAFAYCTGLGGGWKMPSADDFNGLIECSQCLPPLGTYPEPGVPYVKWYWTDTSHDEEGFASCIHFVEETSVDMIAKCTKTELHSVRCIRDN